jgi:seryl-tRNA synthetase
MPHLKLLNLGCNGFPDIYRGSEKRRFGDESLIDQILIVNFFIKNLNYNQNKLKWKVNILSKLYSQLKTKETKKLLCLFYILKIRFLKITKKLENFIKFRNSTLIKLGNLIHNTCVFSETELNLRIENSYDIRRINKSVLTHIEILKKIMAVDYKRGISVAGNRSYFFKNIGTLLNFSLIRYGLDFLSKKRFINLQTPFFMKNNLLKKCTQLHDFSEQLYELGNSCHKFLIATSEQPISAFHSSEKISFTKLPLRYSGFSTCFRKEGGSHGKDTSGIFRVHQFEKVEQFIIGKSDRNSWKLYEEMLENSRGFYKTFDIPFHLTSIPSGSINLTASKKIDILGFFPSSKSFRELVSCSNCTTHQSKKLLVEYKLDSGLNKNVPVSMLNSTLCATGRLICCICENYQQNDGISIPFVLRSYTGISFLPYWNK